MAYVDYVHNGLYRHAAHTRLLCRKLDEIENKKDARLMIFMPPRHGKSMTVTETFPSYVIGRNPEKRVIISSYGDDLAQDFGRRNRNKLAEFGEPLFGIAVARDKGTMKAWDIEGHRGGLICAGIGGAITGKGADLLIIDDPVKNQQEADSETYRNRVYREYESTLRTRLHAGGGIIIILTRWHEDDLAGRLLRKSDEVWDVINLPAICESEDDLLGRPLGTLLWPQGGYGEPWAQKTEREVGSRVWASLYQQRPAPAEGYIFKREWWKFYTTDREQAGRDKIPLLPEHFDTVIQSWDFTFKETKGTDYVVGQIWGKVGADSYLIDQWRDRADFVRSVGAMRSMTAKWPMARQKYIEDKANGSAVISTLRRDISGIQPVTPKESKEARAYSVTPEIEAGNVFLPSPEVCPWVLEYIEEFSAFPNGANDDQVDGTTQALSQLYKGGGQIVNVVF